VLVFSGVCVGRGYVNDPERTRLAFTTDPHRAGERLYRSGDFGRWLPEGKLEFLGRRDTQVKIRGFRIEIGEIDNTLLRIDGVRDGAVVVAERSDRSTHLVAFYCGPRPLPVSLLRRRLGESLPEYMVPAAFHWRPRLPLTANSKIDRKALTALAAQLAVAEPETPAPVTPTEHRLAAAWAAVLGIPQEQIGRSDHFFDRGGTSLSAVKLAIALQRAVSLTDITRHPVLADLAGVVDGRSERRRGLLQPRTDIRDAGTALVCFPHAGGNAINFRPLAHALRPAGVAVHAVELPGPDLAAEWEPFAPLAAVVEQVAAEIVERDLTGLQLWGHSSGAAFAVATARALQQRGVPVARVVIGAQLPGAADARRAAVAQLRERTDADLAADLAAETGHVGLGELDVARAAHVGAAYRHDCTCAHEYFADALQAPPAEKLLAPITVVLAADDPLTTEGGTRYRDWGVFAEHVELVLLTDGGHHFPRTRPAEAAQAVLRPADFLSSSRP
jgi:surfactin synthase thioesterase subunit